MPVCRWRVVLRRKTVIIACMNKLFAQLTHFHKQNRVLTHVLVWSAILLLGSMEQYSLQKAESASFGRAVLLEFMSNHCTKIPVAYFVVYLIVPRFFTSKKYLSTLALFAVGMYVIYAVTSVFQTITLPWFGVDSANAETLTAIFTQPQRFYQDFFFRNVGIAVGLLLVKLLINQATMQQRALLLEKQKTEIELRLLKAQLNPHFLFNTLNNIYSLSLYQSPATSECIGRLSEILDYILYRCHTLTVPLSGEINLLENYIVLEKLRYDERLRVSFKTDVADDIEIAPLILLSMVENAFKHGAGEDAGNPWIDIDLRVKDSLFEFTVENSFAVVVTEEPRKKIGLQNLRQQLDLIYPDNYNLITNQAEERFTVKLTIINPSKGEPKSSENSIFSNTKTSNTKTPRSLSRHQRERG